MKKNLLPVIIFSLSFLMQSCYTTKTIVNEDLLRKQFVGLAVEDVEHVLGQPDDIQKYENR